MSTTTVLVCRACGEHTFFGYATSRERSRFVCEVCEEKEYVRTRARGHRLKVLVAMGVGLSVLGGAAYSVATARHGSSGDTVRPHE